MKTDSSIRSTASAFSPVAGQTGGRNNPGRNYSVENVALDTARPQEIQRQKCAERAKLAHAVGQAVLSLNARSRGYQDARERKENTFQFSLALENARAAEHAAVHAYHDHIKKHGCRS
jgi:hypothetical protein